MISWPTILYGAALTLAVTALLVGLAAREHRALVAVTAGLAAGGGALVWNAILRSTTSPRFFVDAPLGVLPASWQDTVSGVFALSACGLALGLGPLRNEPSRRVALLALLAGVIAFAVDVYLY